MMLRTLEVMSYPMVGERALGKSTIYMIRWMNTLLKVTKPHVDPEILSNAYKLSEYYLNSSLDHAVSTLWYYPVFKSPTF
jgi:hypothetical protein